MALAKPAGFAFRLLILDAFSPHELQPGRRQLREDWRDIGDVREHASELTCCGEVQNEVAIVQRVAAGDFVGPSFDKIDIGQVFVVVVRTKAEQIDSEVLGRVPIRVYCVGLTGDTQNFAGTHSRPKLGKLCAEPGQFSVRHSKSGLRGSALEKNW